MPRVRRFSSPGDYDYGDTTERIPDLYKAGFTIINRVIQLALPLPGSEQDSYARGLKHVVQEAADDRVMDVTQGIAEALVATVEQQNSEAETTVMDQVQPSDASTVWLYQ